MKNKDLGIILLIGAVVLVATRRPAPPPYQQLPPPPPPQSPQWEIWARYIVQLYGITSSLWAPGGPFYQQPITPEQATQILQGFTMPNYP